MTPAQAAAHDDAARLERYVAAYRERFGRLPSRRALARFKKEMAS